MRKITKTTMIAILCMVHCPIMLILISLSGFSQNVAINTTMSPANPSAGLDIDFPDKGFLLTRIPLSGLNIVAPLTAHVAGMVLYNTATTGSLTPGIYVNDGTKWIPFSPPHGTTNGDMQYWDGSSWTILNAGQPGQKLQLTSTGIPAWSSGTIPLLTTMAISGITSVSAISGGNITTDGGTAVTVRGVCWSTMPGPSTALTTKTNDGTGMGSFTSNITGLSPATTYYVRAYATNSSGTVYGNQHSFITP